VSDRPPHPGTITFVDGLTGEVTRTEDASEVPDGIRYANGPDGRPQPVTRIEITTFEDRREIRQYGPDGTILRSTYQRAE
jgi:hypothetical protein